ncbi:glycosyltransferase [Pseudomonas sp. V98_8]|jgi:glycosyltransferase involved in cell wall biosynthesis|uniref:glycosyltransferase n=1 Tax=Pseudomonas sp. V98_8 TaxID=3044228 RepID=UPI00249E3AF0|nr:glycosyltransferase [Pseudomonas sp. V98_8]MDI3394702.1 glycosyltransferase [Pseudomonas sp. V98_8]
MGFSEGVDVVSDGFRPLVTIVIPVYNGGDFLAEAIQSALDQSYPAIEVIVVNDGSNDGGATECIARSFGESIRYLPKDNGGVASALNLAIREMSGDYFSWLSHDDLYDKEKISQQVAFLSVHGSASTIVYSDYSIFTNKHVSNSVPVTMPGVNPVNFRYWITSESALHGCSLLIPRTAFDSCGCFNENLRTTQDYELWFRMAGQYRFLHLPKVLMSGRSHANQDTHKIADLAFAEARNLYLGFVKSIQHFEVPGSVPSEIGASYLRLASGLWQRGFDEAALYCAGKARDFGVSLVQVHGVHLSAYSAKIVRRSARRLLTPQSRQVIRRFFIRFSAFFRGRQLP